jgi:hypothetical protein
MLASSKSKGNYKNVESETSGHPTGKPLIDNLKTVTKSWGKFRNYKIYAIQPTLKIILLTSEI